VRELASIPNSQRNEKYVWENQKDLSNCSIRIGYMYVKPLAEVMTNHSWINKPSDVQIKKHKRGTLSSGGLMVYGHDVQLLSLIQPILNFSIEWVHVHDEKYGSFDSKINDWNGIVGMLKRNEIDTSILYLSITTDRKSVISYSVPAVEYHLGLFLKKPGPSWSWTTFLDVFNKVYWLTVCAFISCFTVCLYAFKIYSHTDECKTLTIPTKMEYLIHSLTQCLRIFVAFDVKDLNDTSSRLPHTKKILTLVMYFCGMLNFHVYTAGLISYLMVQNYDIPIDTLDDISQKPSIKLLLLEGSFDEDFLRYSTNQNYKSIWEKTKEQNGLISSYEEAEKQLLRDEEKVLFGYSPDFELGAKSYPCHVVKTRGIYFPHYGAYPFSKNSPYIEVFNKQIDKVLEQGLYRNLFEETKEDEAKCETQTTEYFRTLSYNDVNSAFLIFVLGCLLALIYLATEFLQKCYYAFNRDHRRIGMEKSSQI
jgi:hypothetical protein